MGGGGTSPTEFGVGTLMQIAPPPDFVMFQNFNARLLALRCSDVAKRLSTPLF